MKRDHLAVARSIAINREIDAAAEQWLIGCFRRWFDDGADPHQLAKYLRFPSSRRRAEAERNTWLREVAEELPARNQAATLKNLIDEFMAMDWPHLRWESEPPAGIGLIKGGLFFAAAAGAPMTIGRHQLRKILIR